VIVYLATIAKKFTGPDDTGFIKWAYNKYPSNIISSPLNYKKSYNLIIYRHGN